MTATHSALKMIEKSCVQIFNQGWKREVLPLHQTLQKRKRIRRKRRQLKSLKRRDEEYSLLDEDT